MQGTAKRREPVFERSATVGSFEEPSALEPKGDKQRHAEPSHDEVHVHRADLVRIGFATVAVVTSWFQWWRPVARIDLVALIAALVAGYPIFEEAFSALRVRRMTMELSMTIAIVAALLIGEAFTALVIVSFVLVAEVLEHLTVGRGRRAIRDLLDFLPRTVHVRRPSGAQDVGAERLEVGDVVIIKPGGRVPVDGVVVSGHSFVDQATITGESLPVEKIIGSAVFAGTLNQSGALEVRASRLGRDTAFAHIVEAVERAEKSKARIEKTADRLSGYLVYFALGAALFTFLITQNLRATISVIIVAGACGIAAGTPLAVLGAIGRAARLGAIIKGGLYLEQLGQVDTVVLDKTGTLTLGVPKVIGVYPAQGVSIEELVSSAATAERPSEHPLGKAVLQKALDLSLKPLEPERFEYTPGRGILCTIANEHVVVGSPALLAEQGIEVPPAALASPGAKILVGRGGRFLGLLEVADVVRPEAAAAIAALRRMGLHTVLLTGDSASVAEKVAAAIGVNAVHAELLPEQKLDHVKALQESGRKVVMVGDGINDAPALMQADVGVAMGSGTDVARESASVVLLGDSLLKFVETMRIARRCRRIILQNFVGTLAVDGVGVVLAAIGLLNPLMAAFVHVASELLFISNSARLVPTRFTASGSRVPSPNFERRGCSPLAMPQLPT